MGNNDLEIIHAQLKDEYHLVLTNTFALNDGYEIDVPVLCGESKSGKFHLYKEADDFDEYVFAVDLPNDMYTHWHPQTKEQALKDVIAFMEGTHKFCL